MNIVLKYDTTRICRVVLEEQLLKSKLNFSISSQNEVTFDKELTTVELEKLRASLENYGIEIVESRKLSLVQNIKDTIIDMVWNVEKTENIKTSIYLSAKLGHSYGYLSSLFSEITHFTIENFIIFQRTERLKQLLAEEKYSLTEISNLLNYSSLAHLSGQFKKTTGFTPSSFQRIIRKRRDVTQFKVVI